MLKEAEKERDTHIVEEENDDERQERYDSQEEDGNAARDGQIGTDSEAIATLKLQLELEEIKAMRSETDAKRSEAEAKRSEADAKRVEMELLMQLFASKGDVIG